MTLTTDVLATLWSVLAIDYLIWFAFTGDPMVALRGSLGFIFLVIFAVCLSLLVTEVVRWGLNRSIDGFAYVIARVPWFLPFGGGK